MFYLEHQLTGHTMTIPAEDMSQAMAMVAMPAISRHNEDFASDGDFILYSQAQKDHNDQIESMPANF